jgi:hypothetical protein
MLLHSSRVHVPCSGKLKLSLRSILMLTYVCTNLQRNAEALFMPFILSSIRSTTRATDSNIAERQRSVNNIAQHPRYRKAILRIGESNYNVFYQNHLYTKHIHFSFISYYIAFFQFHHCRLGSDQYASRCTYPNGHYVYCISHSFVQLICLHPTAIPFTCPRQAVFFAKSLCN